MFYINPLIYINANFDTENNLVEIKQVNSYKYPFYNFINEIEKARKQETDLEIYCILGNKNEIKSLENEIKEKINKMFDNIKPDNIENIIDDLKKNIGNIENPLIKRFCDMYISTILENEKLKFPRMTEIETQDGILCLGLYVTNSPKEEKQIEVDSAVRILLEKEKTFYMGKQIIIQSFLLEDIKDRKILAVLPNIEGQWYVLLEGGIKLYLDNQNPYHREKISSHDIGRFTNLEIESILKNPVYAYKKFFEPYELFEEWNNVFLYALATLPIEYEFKDLEILYTDFLEFIENNICYVVKANETILPKEMFVAALMKNIDNIREYLKGKEELGISKNMLILLKSRYSYLPIIYKIIEKHYSQQVLERLEFTQFSTSKWKELLEEMQNKESNYDKGVSLEDVAQYFIDCIKGLKVTERRAKTENEEMDLVCCNVSKNQKLWELGPVILIECKNWKENVDTKVIRNLS